MTVESTTEWLLAKEYLSSKFTSRTGLCYFNHVVEGCEILRRYGADIVVQQAFCLHPLTQSDADLTQCVQHFRSCDPYAVALVMEYRWIANQYTLHNLNSKNWVITHSPLAEVDTMLVADKVQNRKDFLKHFTPSNHPKYDDLVYYFDYWLCELNITEQHYQKLIVGL